jgi:hypothetical protein
VTAPIDKTARLNATPTADDFLVIELSENPDRLGTLAVIAGRGAGHKAAPHQS